MSQNNAVPTEESMVEFGEVFLRAIELAWRDEEFKSKLLKTDTEKKGPMDAIEHYFGYRGTWNFRFEVVTPEEMIKRQCEEVQQEHENKSWGWLPDKNKGGECSWILPNNGMSFGLPSPPSKLEQFPVALALYNDAGPMYLFSCC